MSSGEAGEAGEAGDSGGRGERGRVIVHLLADVRLELEADVRVVVRPLDFLGEARFRAFREAATGARYDAAHKRHIATVDRLPGILTRLRTAGFDVTVVEAVTRLLSRAEASAVVDLQAARQRFQRIQDDLNKRCGVELSAGKLCGKFCRGRYGHEFRPMRLYEAQKVGVEWLSTRRRALLADAPGVGKSVQTLCSVSAAAPVVVVCPAVMKSGWVSEIKRWRPSLSPVVLSGRTSFRWPKPEEVIIANFEILPEAHKKGCPKVRVVECAGCSPLAVGAHKPDCKRGKFPCPGCSELGKPASGTVLVVDEAHALKNPDTRRAQACRALRTKVLAVGGNAWALTGTPILNEADELWNLLDVFDLAHEAFGSRKHFEQLFGGRPKFVQKLIKGKLVTKMVGMEWGEVDPEAPSYLQRVCLRRTLADVRSDMPEKTTKVIPVDIDDATIAACDKIMTEIGGAQRIAGLLSLKSIPFQLVSTVRAALASAKIPSMLEIVESFEEQNEPLLVFSAYRAPIHLLGKRDGWAVITGDTPAKQRGEIVEAFQKGELRGVGGTIQAMGVGITMTRAANVLFNDLEWTPSLNEQAEARVLRHGQTRPVLITVLVASHLLDERLTEILTRKAALIDASVEAARERGVADDR